MNRIRQSNILGYDLKAEQNGGAARGRNVIGKQDSKLTKDRGNHNMSHPKLTER